MPRRFCFHSVENRPSLTGTGEMIFFALNYQFLNYAIAYKDMS